MNTHVDGPNPCSGPQVQNALGIGPNRREVKFPAATHR